MNSTARSSSPHTSEVSKGSPGLRPATLGTMNRSNSPATGAATSSSSSSVAPWAKVKAATPSAATAKSSGRTPFANPDFPTAAEAAAYKRAQEEKEKQEAAEAAARHEQYLKNLERFRGTAIGSGRHWDELDDEDGGFLDEVVEFADGTQYKIPAQPHQKESEVAAREAASNTQVSNGTQVSKEERFRDVDHDRSWPVKSSAGEPQRQAESAPTAGTAAQSAPQQQQPQRRPVVKETLDISSGAASISLEEAVNSRSLYEPVKGSRYGGGMGGSSSVRRYEDSLAPNATQRRGVGGAQEQDVPSQAAARAWGPLAQRQASLNPNAPKPTAATGQEKSSALGSPIAAATSPPVTSQAQAPPMSNNSTKTIAKRGVTATDAAAEQTESTPVLVESVRTENATGSRPLPPHMAAQHKEPAVSDHAQTKDVSSRNAKPTTIAAPQFPVAPWKRVEQPSREVKVVSEGGTDPTEPDLPASSAGPTEREEMLSAAERARRRRQEEEALRAAERERARQKALAIEEKMRQEAEQKAAAEKAEIERIQEERERERLEIEKKIAADEAKAVLAAQEQQQNTARPTASSNLEAVLLHSRPPPASSASHGRSPRSSAPERQHQVASSPSDEAVTWRRAAPLSSSAISPAVRSSTKPVPPPSANGPTSPQLLRRPAAHKGDEGLPSLDGAIHQIKEAASSGSAQKKQPEKENRIPSTATRKPLEREAKLSPKRILVGHHSDQAVVEKDLRSPASLQAAEGETDRSAQTATKVGQWTSPEPFVTRQSLPDDARPVWNRFKVSVGAPFANSASSATSKDRRKSAFLRNQRDADVFAKGPYILTWEPPIQTLSARTLNRDDEFFRKRFHKGKVITAVGLPQQRFRPAPPAQLAIRSLQKTQSAAYRKGEEAGQAVPASGVAVRLPNAQKTSSGGFSDGNAVPMGITSMRGGDSLVSSSSENARMKDATVVSADGSVVSAPSLELSSKPELDFGNNHNRRGAASTATSNLAFSQPAAVGSGRAVSANWRSGTRSPVFMVNSELESTLLAGSRMPSHDGHIATAGDLLGSSRATVGSSAPSSSISPAHRTTTQIDSSSSTATHATSAVTTPLLPSSGLGPSTWGHSGLSFLDTNAGSSHPSPAHQRQHYQDVWSRDARSGGAVGEGDHANRHAMLLPSGSNISRHATNTMDHHAMPDIAGDPAAHESLLPSTLLNDDAADSGIVGSESDMGLDIGSSNISGATGSRSAPNASPNLLRSPQIHLGGPNAGPADHRAHYAQTQNYQQRRQQYQPMHGNSLYYGNAPASYARQQSALQQYPSQYIDAASPSRGGYGRTGSGPNAHQPFASSVGGYNATPSTHVHQQTRRQGTFGEGSSTGSMFGPVDGAYGQHETPSRGQHKYPQPNSHFNDLSRPGSGWDIERDASSLSAAPGVGSASGHYGNPRSSSTDTSPNASRMPFARPTFAPSGESGPSSTPAYLRGYQQSPNQHQTSRGKAAGFHAGRQGLSAPEESRLSANASAFQQRNQLARHQHGTNQDYRQSSVERGGIGQTPRGGKSEADGGGKTPRQQSQETAAALWS